MTIPTRLADRHAPAATVARFLTERARRLPDEVTVDVDVLGVRDLLADPVPPPAAPGVTVPVRLYGRTAYAGPVQTTVAGGSPARPCVRCLERRWQEIRAPQERRALETGNPTDLGHGAVAALPTALERLWAAVGHLVAQPSNGSGTATVYEIALEAATVRRHTLVADSLCPGCATPAPDTAVDATWPPTPRPKPAADQHRLRRTDEYQLDGYVDPAFGLLGTAAMRVYRFQATAPVSGVFRIRSKYDLHDAWWSGHATSYADSERCGILEGLERYAGQQPRSRAVSVHDSYTNLAPDALDPRDCGGYRADFYAAHHNYQPFTPDLPLPWVWGQSLRDQRPMLVPEQLVYYLDRPGGQRNFVQECSNGCASGSCPEEAALHGLLELIERDAFLLAWYSASPLPEIDIRTVRSPDVQFMRERVGLFGYDVRLFDMRADLPVPVVMAVAVRRDGGLGTLCFAAGGALDPEAAVRAALAETASYVPGFTDRVTARLPEVRAMAADYGQVLQLSDHALLFGLPEMAPHASFLFHAPQLHSMDDLYANWRARPATDDLTEDLRQLVAEVATLGSDVVVVDQTCPEQRLSGVHTAAVIAPGLIPIDFGWARQRVLHHTRFRSWLERTGRPAHLHPHPFP
jgi:ribosomal protein S12 methylthiotransferase accessory factor